MKVAISYWDPSLYVFRFNRMEIYPLIEEFVAIIGNYLDIIPIIPVPIEAMFVTYLSCAGSLLE